MIKIDELLERLDGPDKSIRAMRDAAATIRALREALSDLRAECQRETRQGLLKNIDAALDASHGRVG